MVSKKNNIVTANAKMQNHGWIRRPAESERTFFFECVGKNETCSLAINHAAPGGKVCLVGNPYSDMLLDKQVYWKILRNQLTVTGTWNSSFTGEVTDDWHMIVHLLKRKKD